MSGWLKLHRSILEWGWYSHPVTRDVFIHLLLLANHESNHWQGETILPGQAPVGRRQLAKDLGFGEQQIRTALTNLQSTSEVTIKKFNKFSLITIINWELYQANNQQNSKHLTSNQPATNHTLRSKEVKKEDVSPDFEEFWEKFPRQRRGAKDKACKAWGKAMGRSTAAEVLAGLVKYARSTDVSSGYAKGADSWLNADGWTNTYEIGTKPTSGFGRAGL